MDVISSNFLPGDPRLIEQIVYELKSQGIFDHFRKECIADVDTKPAYQNLSQRVESSVMSFLNQQRFTEDINKNQLREQLRKNITESGFLESGVERIVDQVVNPKINTVFLPKVEDVVYRFLGIERPNQENKPLEVKQNVEDLLPNDLEAVSPESVNDQILNSSAGKNNDNVVEANDNSLNSSNNKTEDESPPFEPLEENTKFSVHEENSVDSRLSGISGLASQDSVQSSDVKMDVSQDISQNSINSEGNLSLITSEEGTKMEICEDTTSGLGDNLVDKSDEVDSKICSDVKNVRPDNDGVEIANNVSDTYGEVNSKGNEEKKLDSIKSDAKKSHEKHRSRSDKSRKDDKDKRSQSKSDSKREKSSSKSTSKDKEKGKKDSSGKEDISEKNKIPKKEDKEKDKNKEKNSSKTKDKEKSARSKERSEKSKDKSAKDRGRSEKEKANKDELNKDKLDKEKSDKEKSKTDADKHKSSRDKEKSDKIKSEKDSYERDKNSSIRHTKEKASNSLNKDHKEGDKNSSSRDRSSSSNKNKESSSKDKRSSSKDQDSSKGSKDKDKSKTSSSGSKDKEKDKKGEGDVKSKASDKYNKRDKDKHSSSDKNNLPSKKSKDKKVTDDHYSMKDKKSDRRSTDRDSNDGSSKTSRNSSLTDTCSSSQKSGHKESSEMFSSGGGESSNSDQVEESSVEESQDCFNSPNIEVIPPPIRYIKPKFASNIHEAMKIMKIRKRLAKLERQNQLALVNVPVVSENMLDSKTQDNITLGENIRNMSPKNSTLASEFNRTNSENAPRTEPVEKQASEIISSAQLINNFDSVGVRSKKTSDTTNEIEETPLMKSHDLSMETFEALEARLAEEMSNINVHMYGDEDDSYEYSSIIISPVKKRKLSENPTVPENKPLSENLELDSNITRQKVSMPIVQDSVASSESVLIESDVQKTTLESKVINDESKETVFCVADDNVENESELIVEEPVEITVEQFPFTNHEHIIPSDNSAEEIDTVAVDISEHVDNTGNIYEYSTDLKAIQRDEPIPSEDFKGFETSDKDDSLLLNINQLITKLSYDINKKQELREINVDSAANLMKLSRRLQLQNLVGGYSFGSPLSVGIKETKHRACLQNNGKKIFIKIDKLNIEVTPKVLVTLQDGGLDEVVKKHIADKIRTLNDVKGSVPNGAKDIIKSLSFTRGSSIKQNGHVTRDDSTTTIISSRNVAINPVIEGRINEQSLVEEDENSPCFFFDKSNNVSNTHLIILKDAIGRLQKSIEDQSLKIHNNIPTSKKRGRKKKAPSENNNSLCCDYKPERKRRLLSDANSNQNMDNNMCNTNVSSQSFTLPLSPAESDKSGEQNKGEPATVNIKRTRRGTATKRYSSEDLYKPRPILSCTSTRRRSSRIDDNRP